MASASKTKTPARAANQASVRTRARVLNTAIDLFNRRGTQVVSLEQIASKAGISRGNLSYHFKRKQDVIRATLTVLEERLREALSPPPRISTAENGALFMIHIVEALWGCRFIFNNLPHLLTEDKILRARYFQFQAWALDTIDRGFGEMERFGDLTTLRRPNCTRILAKNVWNQWLSWLHIQHIENPSAIKPNGAALYDCALHHWALLEPYFSESYAKDLLAAHRRILIGEPALPEDATASA